MYGCESWTIKKAEHWRIDAFKLWCQRTHSKDSERTHCPHPWTVRRSSSQTEKKNQLWIFTGSIDDEAEAPVLWPLDVKSQLTGKDPDAGKNRWQEEKGVTEDEMAGWHNWLNGYEFEQTPEDSEGQVSLACCSSWSRKESHLTYWLNINNYKIYTSLL